MKKNIIAFAVAAALVAPAAAMANTTLYGHFHVSYDFLSGDNAANTTGGISSNSSRIGIKGSEKINDGLSVIYQYETTIDAGTNGTKYDNKTGLYNKAGYGNGGLGGERNTFIGVTGGFGTAIVGRHDTPMKMMGRKYDLFNETIGDSRDIISGPYANWDLRTPQTIAYATPDLMGFKATLAYANNTNTAAPAGVYGDQFKTYSASASYSIAGFGLDAAYEQHKNNTTVAPANSSQDAYRLGVNYKIAGFKVMGLYQDIKNVAYTSDSVKSYGAGAAYSFGANTIKAQYYKADSYGSTGSNGGDLLAVGYDYKMSKQTSVYAMYAQTKNDTNGMYTIMGGGHDSAYPQGPAFSNNTVDAKSSAVSVGIVHNF
ncbi:porin [Halothiobacillus sp.]|uniref:porin n=1 Tax=Halothiobacillus sp. TaxID=1891311 RepID=UPI002AD37591|nr:porin [Halothiobacillus sp.]